MLEAVPESPRHVAVTVPRLGVLTSVTVVLFTFLRIDRPVTNADSCVLQAASVLFVVWIVAETAEAVDLLTAAQG